MKFDKLITVSFLLIVLSICSGMSFSQEFHPKSVVKNAYGQTFVCVDINLQQSLEHPSLHNHTIQMKPTSVPPPGISADLESVRHPDTRISSVTCPYGTIPVLRSYGKYQSAQSPWKIEENMSGGNHFRPHTAMAGIAGTYYGYNARISVYQPQVGSGSEPRFSGAIAYLQSGDPPNTSSLYAGCVDPHFYGDSHAHLQIHWNDNGRGCTNLLCPGFVQVSNKITPGAVIEPVSVVNGTQYAVTLQVYQDSRTRLWWLAYGEDGHQVGYWPGTIFSHMTDAARLASWGGVVQGKRGKPLPPMGSGELPEKGPRRAAYIKDARILVNRGNKRVFLAPGVDLFRYVSDPSCYKVGPFGYANGVEFFFGGPECHDY
ncbi:hypothetical protein ACP70R_000023 [Stipagrostis hirtigluma subsp. patula]